MSTEPPLSRPLLYGLFFVSGFSALVYQTAWQRLLGLFSGSDTVSATIVVGAFLLGLGSLWGAALADRLTRRGAVTAFALCEIGIAVFAALSPTLFYDLLFGELIALARRVDLVAALTFLALLPPTLLMGLSLPLLARAIAGPLEAVATDIGLLYGVNTAGAAFGAFAAGWLLIGTLGYAGTIYVGAVLNLAVAARIWVARRGMAAEAATGGPRGGVTPLWHAHRQVWTWSGLAFLSGFLVIALEIVWFRLLGVLVHPEPRSVLIIGHGGGATLYAASANPVTERIRVIEIIGPVYEVTQRLAERTGDPGLARLLADPRIERHVGDGRHALFTDERRYDVIEADALYPHSSHAGLLFSAEFFRQVRGRLNPGGLYVQWRASERTERTFRAVFPYIVRMGDLALLGSDQPITVDMPALAARLRGPAGAHLRDGSLNPERVLEAMGKPERSWLPGEDRPSRRLNTDLFPRDEYYLNHPIDEF